MKRQGELAIVLHTHMPYVEGFGPCHCAIISMTAALLHSSLRSGCGRLVE